MRDWIVKQNQIREFFSIFIAEGRIPELQVFCTHLLSGREAKEAKDVLVSSLPTSLTGELHVIVGKHCEVYETFNAKSQLSLCCVARRTYTDQSQRPKIILRFTETRRLKKNDSGPCQR